MHSKTKLLERPDVYEMHIVVECEQEQFEVFQETCRQLGQKALSILVFNIESAGKPEIMTSGYRTGSVSDAIEHIGVPRPGVELDADGACLNA